MCDVLDRVEQRGIAQGIAQGIEQGMAQGIEQGISQGMAQGKTQGADEQAKKTAINLRDMGLAPADIARAIDRSVSLVQRWLGARTAQSEIPLKNIS